tara:strand:+ start:57 stop:776 length:720 start_codon:yes stop_codon:yes gene_type:complete
MEKSKKIKIFIGLFYLIVFSSFLYFFLSKFSLEELTSYEFIKNNREYFFDLKKSNLVFLSFVFFVLTILWVLMAGFGSPVALLAGFIFGQWLGIIIVALGLTIGATFLYIFGNYFLKDFIKNKFLARFKILEKKFKKAEFLYLLVYRFIGGIPFALSNLLPCIFNVKVKNFFFATLLGITPQLFLFVSLGSGIEKIIKQNLETPKIKDLLFSPEIYIPILGFIGLVLLTVLARKIFYRN